MAKNEGSTPSTRKRLCQTLIHEYFNGYKATVKIHGELTLTPKLKRRRNTMGSKKRNIENTAESSRSSKAGNHHITTSIRKRKLAVPILSEDEDSDFENNQSTFNISKESNSSGESNKIGKTEILSKNPALSTPEKSSSQPISSTPQNNYKKLDFETPSTSYSTTTTSPKSNDKARDLNTSKSIKILSNVLISSPQSSPEKNSSFNTVTKKEEKKINYETLHVMREFFLNVLKNKNLQFLLDDIEKNMLYRLFNVDKDSQYTCIKLFLWKPIWYNIFKCIEKINLKKSDNDVCEMYNCLKDNNFVCTNYLEEDLVTLLNLLGLKELREIKRSFKLSNPDNTKYGIIVQLLKNCKTQGTLTITKSTEQVLKERVHEKLGFCVKISDQLVKALKTIYILNTFTNSNFLRIQDYFKEYSNIAFPDYTIEDLQIFGKEEFSKFAEALELKRELEDAIEKKNNTTIFQICTKTHSVLTEILDDTEKYSFMGQDMKHMEYYTARYQYMTILSMGSKHLKSYYHNEVKGWLELLINKSPNNWSSKRGHWYCILSLIYTTYLKDYENAAKLIISAFENEKHHLSEIQMHELAFRGKILNRKTYNLPALFHDKIAALSPPPCDENWPTAFIENKTVRGNEPGQKRRYIKELPNGDKHFLSVEQVALEHYKKNGFPNGIHCEGNIICASFCLLFWDIIYGCYVKGAFISKVQNAPLDMYTKYFYLNREGFIKERLNNIRSTWEDKHLKSFLINKWNLHSHESSLVPIDSVVSDPEHLYQIIECIGRSVLAKIFERLVQNYKVFRSGFPDLIVWNYEAKKAKFVEVKGENDHLSIKQKLWLKYLKEVGADVELCHVHSIGSKKKVKICEDK